MHKFRFDLGDTVRVSPIEVGIVIARAEYATAEDSYLVRYVGGDGRLVEVWWGESALTQIAQPTTAQAA